MEVNNELHKQRNEIRDRIKENDEEYRRKKTILNCDEELLKQLKIKAVLEDKNIYELVEQAIAEFLAKKN